MKRPLQDEQDIEFLRQVAITQDKQLKVLVRVLEEKSRLIDELTGRTGDLQATLAFLDAQNVDAQNETGGKTSSATSDAPTTDDSPKEAAPPTGHGPKAQPTLPRETRLFELDEADKTCPACGGELRPMEDQVETSEMIDVVQVEYRLVEVQRQKYSCACGGCVETAPGPERAVEGGRYSLDFAAHVATSKYLDHLPLHRLCRMMKRAGLEVPPNSLWDQLWRLTRLLRPAYDALHRRLLAEPIIGLDQTSWPKLEAKGKKPWQMWGFTAEGMATYKICRDKSADTMKSLLGMLPGIGSQLKDIDLDESELNRTEAIIQSMTADERKDVDLLSSSRRRRIASGSGTEAKDVSQLVKGFETVSNMTRQMSSMSGLQRMRAMSSLGKQDLASFGSSRGPRFKVKQRSKRKKKDRKRRSR